MNKVTLHRINERIIPYFGDELESKFEYNPKGKFKILQKICFGLLKKLGCQIKDTKIIHERTEINLDSLFDAVTENRVMMRIIYNRETKYLIVGKDIYEKFITDVFNSINDIIAFHVPNEYSAKVQIDGVRHVGIFRGLKVILVPYLDGIFCLPDLELE